MEVDGNLYSFVLNFTDFSLGSMLIQFLLLILCITYLINYIKSSKCDKQFPPGPTGLPLVGYLPFIGKEPHKTFANLGQKYGPVLSLQLGNRLTVVLNDYETIKEAFVKQGSIFSGRPISNLFTSKGKEQVLSAADGLLWKVHRQFAFHSLRNLGFGKTNIEPLIKNEIEVFLKHVNKFNGEPRDVHDLLRNSIANNMCVLIFGKPFDLEDPTFVIINDLVDQRIKRYDNINSRLCFPWVQQIPFLAKRTGLRESVALQEKLLQAVRQMIAKHKEENMEEYNNSYIGSYLTEQAKRRAIDPMDNSFDDEKLEGNVVVLFAAGSDTLGLTMSWAMKYLMLYPEIQQRIQDELDRVIGRERTPCWEDRNHLPYTNAAMMEMMRVVSILPLSIAHSNVRETELFGYTIPKRSYVLPNIWGVHHDPKLWGDPENFRPERFIDKDGKIINVPYFIPFSLGPRTCLGLDMARMEYFLYFSMLLQRFTLKQTEGAEVDLNYFSGFTLRPTQFQICFIPR